jgi:hypothetical protein
MRTMSVCVLSAVLAGCGSHQAQVAEAEQKGLAVVPGTAILNRQMDRFTGRGATTLTYCVDDETTLLLVHPDESPTVGISVMRYAGEKEWIFIRAVRVIDLLVNGHPVRLMAQWDGDSRLVGGRVSRSETMLAPADVAPFVQAFSGISSLEARVGGAFEFHVAPEALGTFQKFARLLALPRVAAEQH